MKKHDLTQAGNEYGASGHNLSIDQFNSLKSVDENSDNISNLIKDYNP